MSSKRDPKIWIGDILDSIQEIEDTVSNVEAVNFRENHVLINAVSYALLKITEARNIFFSLILNCLQMSHGPIFIVLATNSAMDILVLTKIKFGILLPKTYPP